jgi:hypothetical protein
MTRGVEEVDPMKPNELVLRSVGFGGLKLG